MGQADALAAVLVGCHLCNDLGGDVAGGGEAVRLFNIGETVTTAAAELPQGSALASLLVVSLLSLPWLAVLLYLFLKANPPGEELLLLDETGSPYRERFLSPAIITIFAIFIVFGLLPYIMA